MHAQPTTLPTPVQTLRSAPRTVVAGALPRHTHRERDYGVGYGNSSGYASGRRYARDWGNVRFRCG